MMIMMIQQLETLIGQYQSEINPNVTAISELPQPYSLREVVVAVDATGMHRKAATIKDKIQIIQL
jgi:hypothetical protein